MSPPQPLVTILRTLHGLERSTDLIVHLDRDPVLLYPELEPLQREAHAEPGEPGEVRLRLRAQGPHASGEGSGASR